MNSGDSSGAHTLTFAVCDRGRLLVASLPDFASYPLGTDAGPNRERLRRIFQAVFLQEISKRSTLSAGFSPDTEPLMLRFMQLTSPTCTLQPGRSWLTLTPAPRLSPCL